MPNDIHSELTSLRQQIRDLQADVEYYKRLSHSYAEQAKEYMMRLELCRNQLIDGCKGYIDTPRPIIIDFAQVPDETRQAIMSRIAQTDSRILDKGDNADG